MRKFKPNWAYEGREIGPIAGIDEAGRGPLAGPVVSAAVILEPGNIPDGLHDSKQLSAKRREDLFAAIIKSAAYGIGIAEPEEIDRINILGATMIAMQRAALDLPVRPNVVLVDGNRAPDMSMKTRTIIKGDSKSLSIAAASIIAKVTRDHIMKQTDIRFSGYGFAAHKGYPTHMHREALDTLGPTPLHRRSFAPVKLALSRFAQ